MNIGPSRWHTCERRNSKVIFKLKSIDKTTFDFNYHNSFFHPYKHQHRKTQEVVYKNTHVKQQYHIIEKKDRQN